MIIWTSVFNLCLMIKKLRQYSFSNQVKSILILENPLSHQIILLIEVLLWENKKEEALNKLKLKYRVYANFIAKHLYILQKQHVTSSSINSIFSCGISITFSISILPSK